MERIQTQCIDYNFIGEGALNLPLVESPSVPKHLLLPAPPTPILLEAKTLAVRIEKIKGKYPRFVQQLMEAGINLHYPEYQHILEFLEQMVEVGIDFHVYSWNTDYDTDELEVIRKKLDGGYKMHQKEGASKKYSELWDRGSRLHTFHLTYGDSELIIAYIIKNPNSLNSIFSNPGNIFIGENGETEGNIAWITSLVAIKGKKESIEEYEYGMNIYNLPLFMISLYLIYLHYKIHYDNEAQNVWVMMQSRLIENIKNTVEGLVKKDINPTHLQPKNGENAVNLFPGYFYGDGDKIKVALARLSLSKPETHGTLKKVAENYLEKLQELDRRKNQRRRES